MFDWLDESGRAQSDTYDERLRMLELADSSGFYAYHLAEHHALNHACRGARGLPVGRQAAGSVSRGM
jgi:hypothetical protein